LEYLGLRRRCCDQQKQSDEHVAHSGELYDAESFGDVAIN
jgi:hypothetical protein